MTRSHAHKKTVSIHMRPASKSLSKQGYGHLNWGDESDAIQNGFDIIERDGLASGDRSIHDLGMDKLNVIESKETETKDKEVNATGA